MLKAACLIKEWNSLSTVKELKAITLKEEIADKLQQIFLPLTLLLHLIIIAYLKIT